MIMDCIVQWATILSPIIAVGLAWWTVISSSKDTDKKIAALEESTTKQVESIKELSRQQMDATIKHVELEIEKNLFLAKQAKQEWECIKNINNSGAAYQVQFRELAMQEFQEKKPERDYYLYCEFIKELDGLKQRLIDNKKKIG